MIPIRPDMPISNTFWSWRKISADSYKKREMDNRILDEATEVLILAYVVQDPTLCIRKLAAVSGVERSSFFSEKTQVSSVQNTSGT